MAQAYPNSRPSGSESTFSRAPVMRVPANDNTPVVRFPLSQTGRTQVPRVSQFADQSLRGLRYSKALAEELPFLRWLRLADYIRRRLVPDDFSDELPAVPGGRVTGDCPQVVDHPYGRCFAGVSVGVPFWPGCLGLQAFACGVAPNYDNIIEWYIDAFGGTRASIRRGWYVPGGNAAPYYWIFQPPVVVPDPWLDPMKLPIQKPVSDPSPPPYRAIPQRAPNPWRAPSEQTVRGPLPVVREALGELRAGVRVAVLSSPRLVPPGLGEKQRKYNANAAGAIVEVFGHATEFGDLADALYDAIPFRLRKADLNLRKGKDGKWTKVKLANKVAEIYRRLDDIDWKQAAQNVGYNEAQDRTFGAAGQGLKKGFQGNPFLNNRPVGLGTGPAL